MVNTGVNIDYHYTVYSKSKIDKNNGNNFPDALVRNPTSIGRHPLSKYIRKLEPYLEIFQ